MWEYKVLVKISESFNQFLNILRLFDVLPNFPFTKSECTIITCKHGIYELPHELPTDLSILKN